MNSDFYIKLRPQTFFKCARFKVFFFYCEKIKKIDFFVLKNDVYLLLKHKYNSKI